LRRARAVERCLLEHGVAGERLQSRAAGANEPIATDKTALGRLKNRRIELIAREE